MTTTRTYQPAPDLGTPEAEAILALADDLGSSGMDRRGPAFDWECFLSRIEDRASVDLGSDAESPLIKAIKRTARKASNETQG